MIEDRGWKIEDRDLPSSIFNPRLVSEMPHASEDHRDAMLVGGSDNLFVFNRAARLDDRFGTGLGRFVETVAERVEGIGGHCRPFEIQAMSRGAQDGDLGRV